MAARDRRKDGDGKAWHPGGKFRRISPQYMHVTAALDIELTFVNMTRLISQPYSPYPATLPRELTMIEWPLIPCISTSQLECQSPQSDRGRDWERRRLIMVWWTRVGRDTHRGRAGDQIPHDRAGEVDQTITNAPWEELTSAQLDPRSFVGQC